MLEVSAYSITLLELLNWWSNFLIICSDLKDLPLGALLRAQRAFNQANASSASDSDTNNGSDSDLEAERIMEDVEGKGKEKVEWSIKPRKDIPKRSNKNAWVKLCYYLNLTNNIRRPIEVTSKRPVTRRRTVVEVPKVVRLTSSEINKIGTDC